MRNLPLQQQSTHLRARKRTRRRTRVRKERLPKPTSEHHKISSEFSKYLQGSAADFTNARINPILGRILVLTYIHVGWIQCVLTPMVTFGTLLVLRPKINPKLGRVW